MRYGGGYGRSPWGGGPPRRSFSARSFLPRSLPQTLQIATWLLYWNAALGLLAYIFAGGVAVISLGLLFVIGEIAAGYGLANERKWGYVLALIAAFLPFVLLIVFAGSIFAGGIFSLIFEIALVVLLVHPMSRSYVRSYFRR
ncbi:MAG: hypothetical protein M0004_16020 [Actinomycetota bacterium]|nr:hypothetical protein [Actinomycetota bacterium]